MKLEQLQSGLVVLLQKPEKPKRRYGPLEIQDEELRRTATEGLSKLWDAMQLSEGGRRIRLPGGLGSEAYAAHYQAYCHIGKMLLGEDCPDREVLC